MSIREGRTDVLQSEQFLSICMVVFSCLKDIKMALAGGLAVSYYANPPATIDIDLLAEASCGTLLDRIEQEFYPTWDLTMMDFKDETPRHCIRMTRKKDPSAIVDFLITGNNSYLKSVVGRSVMTRVHPALEIPVVQIEDLIVMKTVAGRRKDMQDIKSLNEIPGINIDQKYIDKTLSTLGIF